MAVRPIVKLPHSALRSAAEAVPLAEVSTERIKRLLADMKDTLASSDDGVGLAAPQIGAGLRVFLVSEEAKIIDEAAKAPNVAKAAKEREYSVFINPTLKKRARQKTVMFEGCLSVPGKVGEVTRSEKVRLEWYDEGGRRHERGFTKFLARVIQHELDHLDGVLIVDRTKKLMRTDHE